MNCIHFTVNSCVLNPDRKQCVPPITFLSKRPAALNTAETLRVPVLIQSGDHFLTKGLKSYLRWVEVVICQSQKNLWVKWHAQLSHSHLEWACCIARSEGRRAWSSPTRSTAVRPFQRSCDCLTLSHTQCTQSAPGATPSQEPWPPARVNRHK